MSKKIKIANKLKNKKVIIAITVLVLLTLSSIILYNIKKNVYTFPIYSKNTSLEGVEIQSIIEYDPAYIAVHYPIIESQKINDIICNMITKKLNTFKAQIKGKTYKTEKPEFNITFDSYKYKTELISFKFNIYQILPGQENGDNKVETMTFDLKNEKQILIKDLFIGNNYLNVLSEKTYTRFINIDIYWNNLKLLQQGLKPNQNNFNNFILTNDYLELIFNKGQIANKELGILTYKIPIEELNTYLNTDILGKKVDEQEIDLTNPEKVVIPQENLNKLKGKKLIALTYDDGPNNEYTPELLDVLKEEDAKATFFVLGSKAEYYPEIIQRIIAEGHQIGNHSFDHKQFITLSSTQLQSEINKTNNILEEIIGEPPSVIRTPYGEVTDKIKETVDMPIILWDIDTLDWKTNSSADKVYNSIISKAQDGDIILMHDIFPICVQATKRVIERLKEEGYVFVTVETLILAKNGKMENTVYRYVR